MRIYKRKKTNIFDMVCCIIKADAKAGSPLLIGFVQLIFSKISISAPIVVKQLTKYEQAWEMMRT